MKKIIIDHLFGKNIQRIRLSRGLTQEQTVAQLQVLGSPLSRSTYSLIELGRCNIYISDLVGLQLVFKADYEEFFRGIPTDRPQGQRP